MGNLYSGIKRIDEAQRLLMKEYEENGLQFILITRPCETMHGIVFVGELTKRTIIQLKGNFIFHIPNEYDIIHIVKNCFTELCLTFDKHSLIFTT